MVLVFAIAPFVGIAAAGLFLLLVRGGENSFRSRAGYRNVLLYLGLMLVLMAVVQGPLVAQEYSRLPLWMTGAFGVSALTDLATAARLYRVRSAA